MHTIQFESAVEGNIITIPEQFRGMVSSRVKVMLETIGAFKPARQPRRPATAEEFLTLLCIRRTQ
ncbi:hypothetical protein FACS1894103_5170 [Campylobacterota bacterium]|nr:hypothetical protein FACS1894103_5170 [Campylobacterota bacterium]